MPRALEPGMLVQWRDTVWHGPNAPIREDRIEWVMPDMLRFDGGDIAMPREVVAVPCEVCKQDMQPADDAWLNCPNDRSLCIDCCADLH